MPHTVRLHRVLTAKPEKVYRAFIEADALAKWLPPNGFACTVHQLDAKVGGTFKMVFRNFTNGQSHSFGGEYKELVPGERLRYTDKFDDPICSQEMKDRIKAAVARTAFYGYDDYMNPIIKRIDLTPPDGSKNVLMHSCCAPCAGELMEQMLANGIGLTIFFYNPNIHPKKEYEIRKEENIRFAEKMGIPFVDADYDVQNWFARAKGMEKEPERGVRCTMCFDMRFERTALYAHEHGFSVITSSLGISRWKNMEQINDCGHRAAGRYPGIAYWDYNWRKEGGAARMYEIAKREEFYAQQYCGCIYSLRDSNDQREKNGREKIEIGETWYAQKLT